MNYIEDLLGKLFPEKRRKISHKENFLQSEVEVSQTRAWIASDRGEELMGLVYNNYHLKTVGVNKKPEVHILNSPYANGLAISFQDPLSPSDFNHLFFAFGDRLLALGYHRVSLDRKLEELTDRVRITEKLYYKPPFSSGSLDQPIDQLFGNVAIEKIQVDNEPSYLKVLVTVYSDRMYLPALPFRDFVERLFNR
ncbi:hypothetical protein ADIS_3451 [Lunatimonas lonarensis]|uniref:Uncharacterized protein n=1 Tax=Lunatimonas lonarensis TaxID=1232681 RepID=R7ZQJ6_9BACT|nr:hypothetical protein [Lunatimonas lonarensis]EON76323.1 hypothetical protein ADIS_3451 [Lunatimonas lonarensis]